MRRNDSTSGECKNLRRGERLQGPATNSCALYNSMNSPKLCGDMVVSSLYGVSYNTSVIATKSVE